MSLTNTKGQSSNLYGQSASPNYLWSFNGSNVDSITQLSPSFSNNAPPLYSTGLYGLCYSLPNTTLNYYQEYTLALQTPLTISIWFNTTTLTRTGGSYNSIFGLHLPNSLNPNNPGYIDFEITYPGSANLGVYLRSNDATNYQTPILTTSLSINTWYNMCVVFSPTSVQPYLNGVATTSQTFVTWNTDYFRVGASGQFRGQGFPGYVQDLRIYKTALTAQQVQSIYNQSAVPVTSISMTGTPLFSQLSSAAQSSAVGAFSLRAVNGLSPSGTAKAVNVRNGTTSATQDFYADRLGNLLTAPVTGQTLSSWLGGATGYVATWYDQSGQGNHATQSTTANQPQINLTTSPYSLLFTGNQYFQNTIPFTFNFGTDYKYTIKTTLNNTTGGCIFYKGKLNAPNNTVGEKEWYMGQSGGQGAGNFPNHVGNTEGFLYGSPAITTAKTSVTWVSSAYNTLSLYENLTLGSLTPSGRSTGKTDPGSYFYIGRTFASTNYHTGNIYELVIFSSTLGASDVTILNSN
jgi:hypothetical protein